MSNWCGSLPTDFFPPGPLELEFDGAAKIENRGEWRNYAMIYTKNDSLREMSIKDFVFRSSRPILWTIKAKTFFYPNNRNPYFFPTPHPPDFRKIEKWKNGKSRFVEELCHDIYKKRFSARNEYQRFRFQVVSSNPVDY